MKVCFAVALIAFASYPALAADESPAGIRFIKEQVGDVLTVRVKSDYLSEFTVNLGAMNIKARELRGGAIIFLSPRGTAKINR
jgi:hypothetical protein